MQAIEPLTADIPVTAIPRKVWTREEAHCLVELGLPGAEKLELINGELIDRMGKNRPHVIWQQRVQKWLQAVFGSDRVESEAPIDVAKEDNSHSEPEPDLKVLKRRSDEYLSNPAPEDLLLVVEISDSTLDFDRRVKGPLYARAGIVEYWVVDTKGVKLFVHREPRDGRYTTVVEYDSHEVVSPLAAPAALFCLERI